MDEVVVMLWCKFLIEVVDNLGAGCIRGRDIRRASKAGLKRRAVKGMGGENCGSLWDYGRRD